MTDRSRSIRVAQLLLVVAALGVWAASRLAWVRLRSADGLGQPRDVTLNGSTWSTALLPLAILLIAAALAALAVRRWPLRLLAVLVAAASAAIAYLGISLWVVADVSVRAAELVELPVWSLTGADRQYTGAVIAVGSAVAALLAATLLMRGANAADAAKYEPVAGRRAAVVDAPTDAAADDVSERDMWDALDDGRDPTKPTETEGR
ncbi:TIGR02234 family membrane protein [Mycobacterium sp. MYCO198283]|uniref:TIGR02234 family membrane protein n=1 Tax=Mycobacterium sp. MYCO198283 TaxID=2883505 RepID=UPI001E4307BD|nr:TIGR02234 family membrane protein [Mycobacterium sp. MYCO198283]MCG5433500.1 TIGR02234 family membrane protein [Mycobacterium sp. MYCO198283]